MDRSGNIGSFILVPFIGSVSASRKLEAFKLYAALFRQKHRYAELTWGWGKQWRSPLPPFFYASHTKWHISIDMCVYIKSTLIIYKYILRRKEGGNRDVIGI